MAPRTCALGAQQTPGHRLLPLQPQPRRKFHLPTRPLHLRSHGIPRFQHSRSRRLSVPRRARGSRLPSPHGPSAASTGRLQRGARSGGKLCPGPAGHPLPSEGGGEDADPAAVFNRRPPDTRPRSTSLAAPGPAVPPFFTRPAADEATPLPPFLPSRRRPPLRAGAAP